MLDAQPHLLIAVVAELHRLHVDCAVGELIWKLSIQSIELVILHRNLVENHFRMQRLFEAWKGLFNKSPFSKFSSVRAPYKLFDNSTCQFVLITMFAEVRSSLFQQTTLVDIGGPFKSEKDVDSTEFEGSTNTDDALSFVTYFMFHLFQSLVLKCSFFSEGEKWSKWLQYDPKRGKIRHVFQNISDSVGAELKATRP